MEQLIASDLTGRLVRWISEGRRPRAAREGGALLLAFGPRFRLLWWCLSAAALGPAVLLLGPALFADGVVRLLSIGALLLFSAFGVYGLLWLMRAHFYRAFVHDWGLEERLPGGRRRRLDWGEVSRLRYSSLLDCVVFERRGRRPLRLSMELDGLEDLRQVLEQAFGALDADLAKRLTSNAAAPRWG